MTEVAVLPLRSVQTIKAAGRPREQIITLGGTPPRFVGDALKSIKQDGVRTTLLIDREVAFKHAPFGSESIYAMPYILAPQISYMF
jgi:hypothetical protein